MRMRMRRMADKEEVSWQKVVANHCFGRPGLCFGTQVVENVRVECNPCVLVPNCSLELLVT